MLIFLDVCARNSPCLNIWLVCCLSHRHHLAKVSLSVISLLTVSSPTVNRIPAQRGVNSGFMCVRSVATRKILCSARRAEGNWIPHMARRRLDGDAICGELHLRSLEWCSDVFILHVMSTTHIHGHYIIYVLDIESETARILDFTRRFDCNQTM